MRSIEFALARDFALRGAVLIPLVFVAMVAIPLWILELLDINGTLSPTAPETVVLQVSLTLALGSVAAIAVFHAQGRLTRFFMRPISTARLVACQMAFGAVTIALMYSGAAGLLNLGGAGWPIFGPALFLAATLACVLAAFWSFEGTILGQVVGCTATSMPLALWFNRCYGANVIRNTEALPHNPKAEELFALVGIAMLAYAFAVAGVSRTRRGDSWNFAGLRAWWERQLVSGHALPSFGSPLAAQRWSEWREKLSFVPAAVVGFTMLGALGAWICGLMPTDELLDFTRNVPLVLLLAVIPLLFGLLVGNCSAAGKAEMKHFLATRPVTDGFLALVMLRNCAIALFWAWGTWLAGLLVVVGLALLSGHLNELARDFVPASFDTLTVLATIVLLPLMSWTFTVLMTTLIATGRTWFLSVVLLTIFGLVIVSAVAQAFLSTLLRAVENGGGGRPKMVALGW